MTPDIDHEKLERTSHRYGLDLVVVFGSQATGRAMSESDVDVAVRMRRRGWDNPEVELDLVGELVEALGESQDAGGARQPAHRRTFGSSHRRVCH
jgi:predicted nucleotidyltransferase